MSPSPQSKKWDTSDGLTDLRLPNDIVLEWGAMHSPPLFIGISTSTVYGKF